MSRLKHSSKHPGGRFATTIVDDLDSSKSEATESKARLTESQHRHVEKIDNFIVIAGNGILS